ncbi:unnamed protein product [Symbiodinium necroappetens]|uniref:Saccharopine dehydrogenase NADP binding domain-containing protein n=1 Tax=Symbiodinium necroappetens TaxID=1628268 RepID=A0A813BU66_9DINO|nr:unnamed protein product [Symbiodinium necroappetens]
MTEKARWKVVGGGDKGGILVREKKETSSEQLDARLATHAVVEELQLSGERLNFRKLEGEGPETGWVSIRLKGKELLVPLDAENVVARKPAATSKSLKRPYAIAVVGATGFTGRLMVEHLDALFTGGHAKESSKTWVIAGRNLKRLQALASSCSTVPEVLVADSEASLEEVARQCIVLVAAAGPFSQCGEMVLRACVKNHTHYVDITGETIWMHDMLDRYHEEARQKGLLLVQAAAQVCAIDDINCYLLAKKLGPLKQFREYFFSYGGMTGGTFASNTAFMEGMTAEKLKVYNDPFNLGGQRSGGVQPEDHDCSETAQDPIYPSLWLQPAYNGHTGGRVIRRSCQLFEDFGGDSAARYGKDLRVIIRDAATSKRAGEKATEAMAPIRSIEAAKFAAGLMKMQVAQGQMPKPGEGPPPETRAQFYSEVFAVGEAEDGRWAHVHYTGGEAYEVTAMAAVTGALVIVEEEEAMQPLRRGGILTPAFAFHGTTYVHRLAACAFAVKTGRRMTFKLSDGKPGEEVLKEATMRKTKSAWQGQAEMSTGKLRAWA